MSKLPNFHNQHTDCKRAKELSALASAREELGPDALFNFYSVDGFDLLTGESNIVRWMRPKKSIETRFGSCSALQTVDRET